MKWKLHSDMRRIAAIVYAGGETPVSEAATKKKLEAWEASASEKQQTCAHCNKKGHTPRTCFDKHPHLKEQRDIAFAKKMMEK